MLVFFAVLLYNDEQNTHGDSGPEYRKGTPFFSCRLFWSGVFSLGWPFGHLPIFWGETPPNHDAKPLDCPFAHLGSPEGLVGVRVGVRSGPTLVLADVQD